jgi:hypothetical protein
MKEFCELGTVRHRQNWHGNREFCFDLLRRAQKLWASLSTPHTKIRSPQKYTHPTLSKLLFIYYAELLFRLLNRVWLFTYCLCYQTGKAWTKLGRTFTETFLRQWASLNNRVLFSAPGSGVLELASNKYSQGRKIWARLSGLTVRGPS